MNAPIRSILALAVLVPFAVCLFELRLGFDPVDFRQAIRNARRHEELEQLIQGSIRRQKCREMLAQEVIAKRCSLREALESMKEMDREWLLEMDREWPDYTKELVKKYRQDCSGPDWYYSRFTTEVEDLLFNRPSEAAVVLDRLEKEYRQLQAERQTHSSSAGHAEEQNGGI